MKLLIASSKGLLEYHRRNESWQVATVHFPGFPVTVIYTDPRNGRWYAGLAHRHWGQKLHYSDDEGRTWASLTVPKYPSGSEIWQGKAASLKRIWCIAAAGPADPGGLWLGTEPGGLFYSPDNGQTFELVQGLWEHPSRMDQNQWFGAGRDFPFIHSIEVDPRDHRHVYVAISCAGIFETTDGGASWHARNDGLIAAYLPNPKAEVGHDPHRLLLCPANPDILWQQNHCGIFRSVDGGHHWQLVSNPHATPHYGFALAIDEDDPLQAWVIPASSDEERIAPGLALNVCHTTNGGASWTPLRNGLPQDYCFDIVFRHSFAKFESTLAFGTNNGNVYLSENYGQTWQLLSSNLARVEAVVLVR